MALLDDDELIAAMLHVSSCLDTEDCHRLYPQVLTFLNVNPNYALVILEALLACRRRSRERNQSGVP
jgi:hypothetical protein